MAQPQSSTAGATPHEAFLIRVRAALGRAETKPAPPPPSVDESLARLARSTDSLVEMFVKRATLVGMKPQTLRGADLVGAIQTILADLGAKRVVVGMGALPQGVSLKDSLRRKGIEVVDWNAGHGLDVQFDTHAGITDVHAALAETGTIICNSDAGHSRGLSLVPPVHIAVVRRSDILPDMLDYWAKMKGTAGKDMPSSIAFITGPSKTADIEGVMVTGVHGPGTVHILVVEDA